MTSTRAKDEMAKCKSYANYWSIAGSEIDCLSFSNQVFKNLVRVFAFGELSCVDLCTLLCTRPCSDTPLNLSKWYQRHAGARWSERLDAASQKGLLCIYCPIHLFLPIIYIMTHCWRVCVSQQCLSACKQPVL